MCGRNADDKPVYGNSNPVIHTQNNQIFADEFDPNQLLYYQRKNTPKNNAIEWFYHFVDFMAHEVRSETVTKPAPNLGWEPCRCAMLPLHVEPLPQFRCDVQRIGGFP